MANEYGTSSQLEDSIFSRLWDMWREVWSTDVLLECEDFLFPVHSVILAASSKYFKMMLTSNPPSSTLVIAGITASALTHILIFIYNGTLRLPRSTSQLWSLLHAAHSLQVHDLCSAFHLLFGAIINCSNYQELWTLADEFSNERCIKCVLDFVVSNYTQVWIRPNFVHLSAKQILALTKYSAVERVPHSILLQSLRDWIKKNRKVTHSQKIELDKILQELTDRDFNAEDHFYFGDKVPNQRSLFTMDHDGTHSACSLISIEKVNRSRGGYQPKVFTDKKSTSCASKKNVLKPFLNNQRVVKTNHNTIQNMVYIMTNSGVDIERVMGTEAFTDLLQYIEQHDREMAKGFTQILNSETIRKKMNYDGEVMCLDSQSPQSTRKSIASTARNEVDDSAVLQSIASSSKALASSNPEALSEIITPFKRQTQGVASPMKKIVEKSPRAVRSTYSSALHRSHYNDKDSNKRVALSVDQASVDNTSVRYVQDTTPCHFHTELSASPTSFCFVPPKSLEEIKNSSNIKDSQLLKPDKQLLNRPSDYLAVCAPACKSVHVPLLDLSTPCSRVEGREQRPVLDNMLSWKRENGVIRVTTGCQTSPRIVRYNCRRFLRAMAYQVNEIMYSHDKNNEHRFSVPQELFKGFSLHEALSWTRSPQGSSSKHIWSSSTENVTLQEWDQELPSNAIDCKPNTSPRYSLTRAEIHSYQSASCITDHISNSTKLKLKMNDCEDDSHSNTTTANNQSRSGDVDSQDYRSSSVLSSQAAKPFAPVQKKRSSVMLHSSPTKTVLKISSNENFSSEQSESLTLPLNTQPLNNPGDEKTLDFPFGEITRNSPDYGDTEAASPEQQELPSSSGVFAIQNSSKTDDKYPPEDNNDEDDAVWNKTKPKDVFSGSPRRETVIAVIGRKKHGEIAMLYFNVGTQKWTHADSLNDTLNSVRYELLEKSSCVGYKQTVYLLGGLDRQDVCHDTVLALSPDCHPPAILLDSMQMPRHSAGAAFLQHHIYVVGGISNNGRLLNHMERYSIFRNSWRTMPPLPSSGWGMSLVVVGDNLFSMGGRRHSEWTLDCYKYDVVGQQWTRMCKIPTELSLCHVHAVFYSNRILAFRHYNSVLKGNVAVLSPNVMMWRIPDTIGQLPPKRVVTAFVWEKKVWVVDTGARLFKFDGNAMKWEADYPFFRSLPRPLYVFPLAQAMDI